MAEKNEKLMPRGLIPSSPEVLAAAKKYTVPERGAARSIPALDILRQGLCAVGYADILVDYRMREDSVTASKTKMIGPQWRIYREVLGFGVFRSAFYLFTWGMNGLKKYRKI